MKVFSQHNVAAAVAVASATVMMLSGCSGSSSSQQSSSSAPKSEKSGSSSITVWADADHTAAIKDAAAAFTEKTGVKVELVQKSLGSVQQDLITQVPTGKGPDIAIGPNDWTGLLATDGVIQPIELGNTKSKFQKVGIDAFNFNGKVYGLPFSLENVALVRNTKLAAQAPTSWDDMVAAAKAAGLQYPLLIQVGDQGDSYTMYPIETSFGSFAFGRNSDGSYNPKELTIGDEHGVTFAKWLQEQAKAGVLSTSMTADIALSKFEQGASPYLITGPWNIKAIQKAGMSVSVDPIPSVGGQQVHPFVGSNGFFLSAKTKNKLAATNFLTNYIATDSVQEMLYKAGGVPPALTKAYEEAGKDAVVQGFEKAGKDGVPMPNITEMSAVWQSWNSTEVSIINQRGDPTTLWQQMSEQIKSTMEKKS
ncbi:maltose ABC transporter substrate-binding protein [Bombiscardovia nodaiensis]|uniref:Maltose ABC transporter substrate-binding protein n=1 Tax=Bombiscardovia nodaiensis TaxID=2932181 RepID=A0ABM8B5Z4_9BIFI|nr:maltose ABC transporter substrate-binding protein [Bombiscardovia nodaiensis]